MQHFNRGVKTLTETGDGLWRQPDFRDHHQRLFALGEHIFKNAQIDFGFTGTGDARE
ncbi:hypothetical protein D3C87_2126830 [compost metagenome]